MSLKGKFKQPLYKEDLMPVIKQGIFVAFVGGLLIGGVNLLISYFESYSLVWFMSFLMAYFLAKRIRGAYVQYHIWYPIIAVISFIVGFYWSNIVAYGGVLIVLNYTEIQGYLAILNPIRYISFLLPWTWFGGFPVILSNLLSLLFFSYSIYFTYHYSQRH